VPAKAGAKAAHAAAAAKPAFKLKSTSRKASSRLAFQRHELVWWWTMHHSSSGVPTGLSALLDPAARCPPPSTARHAARAARAAAASALFVGALSPKVAGLPPGPFGSSSSGGASAATAAAASHAVRSM
jgi:hypothetical protein